ncbi:MAG: hypothetical protein GC162_06235 [Planctomycetes bacterium]|nr:hypothetical protein [Planctomycetota bacterium]
MSDSRNTTAPFLRLVGTAESAEAPAPEATPESGRRFAHELSNLLDGSLRNMTLALSDIDRQTDEAVGDDAHDRLRTASDGLRQMAVLLRRWMAAGGAGDPARLYWQQSTFGDALHYALKMIEPAAEAANIELTIDVPDTIERTPAGPMYPVIANALQNAVEAIGRDGQVMIRAHEAAGIVTLDIEDNGPGLDPTLPRLGDGWIAPGATTKTSGHGMGLAISRQIVESIGGSIRIETRDGGGTRLSVAWRLHQTQG